MTMKMPRISVNGYSTPAGRDGHDRSRMIGFIHGYEAAIEWAAKRPYVDKQKLRKSAGRHLWTQYEMAIQIKGALPIPAQAYSKDDDDA